MQDFSKITIHDLLEELGSSSPVPGGGSVSAIAASLASRLTEMVANLTLGREKFSESHKIMSEIQIKARAFSDELIRLAQSDTEAFAGFMSALSLPKETEENRIFRQEAMQEALKQSTLIPLEVLSLAKEISSISLMAALHGNPNAITDTGVSALLSEAAGKGAALNARINLSSIHDTDFIENCRKRLETDLNATIRNCQEILTIVGSKVN